MFDKTNQPKTNGQSPAAANTGPGEASPPAVDTATARFLHDQMGDDRRTLQELMLKCAGGQLAAKPADRIDEWTSSEWDGYLRDRVEAGVLPADVADRVRSRVGNLILTVCVAADVPMADVIAGNLPEHCRRGGDIYEAVYLSTVAGVYGEYLRHQGVR